MEKSNKFLDGPYTGKMPAISEMILVPIIFLLIMPIGFMIASMIGGMIYTNMGSSIGRAMSYIYYMQLIIGFGLCLLVLFLFVTKINKRSIRTLGFYKEKAVSQYIKGILVAVIGLTLIILVLKMTGSITVIKSTESFQLGGLVIIPLILAGWVIQGAAEETLIRGYLLPVITVKSDLYKGIVISSIVFAFLHVGNNGITVVSMLNILLCGVALSLLCIHQKSIWGACGFHTMWNMLQGNVFGIAVSGSHTNESIWMTSYVEPSLWNGGGFGIEGSILTTIFFILMSTVLVTRIRK